MIPIIKIQSEIPLAGTCPVRYRGIAFDGCHFFLTEQCLPEITQLDPCFHAVEHFPTCRCYTCLCYDPCACCFWASDNRCPSILFKLDVCFHEVDFIRLRDQKTASGIGVITSISYDEEEKCLLVSSAVGLAWVPLRERESPVTCCIQKRHSLICWVLAAGHYYLYCSLEDGKQTVQCCFKNGAILWECCIPKGFFVDAAVFACSPKKDDEYNLFLLATKHGCCSYLLECVPADGIWGPEYCYPCKPKPPHPEPMPCEDLLESVALAQTALSRVLNAEGEKLQRVIASTDDPDTLLAVNRAVNQAVVNTTFLEQVLYQKLALIQEICDLCKPEDQGPCDPFDTKTNEPCHE